ncbi:MAG: hypothetical protein V2A77_11970, partial [Pseudomonadota bacterium]
HGEHPLDERDFVQKVFDAGLDAYFTRHGQNPREIAALLKEYHATPEAQQVAPGLGEKARGWLEIRAEERAAMPGKVMSPKEELSAFRAAGRQAKGKAGAAPVQQMAAAVAAPAPAPQAVKQYAEPIEQMVKAGLQPAPRPVPPSPDVAGARALAAARGQGQQTIERDVMSPEQREAAVLGRSPTEVARQAALAAEEEGVSRVAPAPIPQEVPVEPTPQVSPAPPAPAPRPSLAAGGERPVAAVATAKGAAKSDPMAALFDYIGKTPKTNAVEAIGVMLGRPAESMKDVKEAQRTLRANGYRDFSDVRRAIETPDREIKRVEAMPYNFVLTADGKVRVSVPSAGPQFAVQQNPPPQVMTEAKKALGLPQNWEQIRRQPPGTKPLTLQPTPQGEPPRPAPKAAVSPAIRQAMSDWNEGRAYIDNRGNYHVKDQPGPTGRGPVAPWNKAVKGAFPDVSAFHKATEAELGPSRSARRLGTMTATEPAEPPIPRAAKGEGGPEFGMGLGGAGEAARKTVEDVKGAWEFLTESRVPQPEDVPAHQRPLETAAAQHTEKASEAVKLFYSPIENNPADRAATAYAKPGGDFKQFIAEMPEFKQLTPAEAHEMKVALRKTRGGKITPAMRQSGFYVSEDFAKYPHKEPGKLSQAWADPDRFIQEIDGGKFGGEAQRQILWPMRRTALARLKFTDEHKTRLNQAIEKHGVTNKKLRQAAGDAIEFIRSGIDAKADPWTLIAERPKLAAVLKGLTPKQQGQVVAFAQELRTTFDNLIDQQNQARAKRGQSAIPYRENYRPWVIETNIWAKTFGLRQRPKEVMESPELPDYIKPNQPFNPRAEARRGLLGKYEKERNLVTLVQDYIETAGRDIFNANVVHNNKIHAEVLRSKGLLKAADGLDRITAETFAGVKPPLSRFAAETIPAPVRSGMQIIRRNLTRAVFPLNWTWNAFIQTSSAGLTPMRYGVKNSLWGLKVLTDPAFREAIHRNAYSSVVKSRWAGSAAYQDMARGIGEMRRLDSRPIEKVEHFASYLTQAIESGLTSHGVASAYRDGQTRLGLKGRELWEYATEGGSKTQSMYNYENIPGLLRNREVGQTAPFQTFAFEIFNTVREMNLPIVRRAVGKTGLYETLNADSAQGQALMSNRMKMLARWTAAIVVTNAVTDYAIGRKAWDVSSFIPFYGLLTGGHTRGLPLFTQYLNEFKEGVRSLIAHGSWTKLRRFALRYHLIGGMQIERTLSGIEAASEGEVSDVRGRTLFKVEGSAEKARAVAGGPYNTAAGIEYRRTLQEKQGIVGAVRKWADDDDNAPPALDWSRPRRRERRQRPER